MRSNNCTESKKLDREVRYLADDNTMWKSEASAQSRNNFLDSRDWYEKDGLVQVPWEGFLDWARENQSELRNLLQSMSARYARKFNA